MICEICGRNTDSLVAIRLEGAMSKVCDNCKKYGSEVKTVQNVINFVSSARIKKEEVVVTDFSKKLMQARQQRGLKQDEFANILKMQQVDYKALETGRIKPSLDVARKLTKALNIKFIEEL